MLLDTPICDFGWQAPEFTLADTDGQHHTLSKLMGENGLLIAFICNHCPYVKAIIDRLVEDTNILRQSGVNSVAIMPNDYHRYADDSPAKIKAFAQDHKLPFPYLIDETQQVAKTYGAVCTPDFFGLNAAKQLQYRGRLDEARMGSADNRSPELLAAMQMVATTGKGPVQQTPSMGCSIKWR